MNKLIIAAILTFASLQAKENVEINVSPSNKQYQFGKNINLIGTWEAIETQCCVNFIFGRYDKIRMRFDKSGKIYKVEKNKEIPTDMIWSTNNSGVVKVEKDDSYYEKIGLNDAAKSIQGKMVKEIFKGVETIEFQILSKENNNCFMVERNLKLCKISGNLHTDPDEVIQIEMH
jgi:hypothetical protein